MLAKIHYRASAPRPIGLGSPVRDDQANDSIGEGLARPPRDRIRKWRAAVLGMMADDAFIAVVHFEEHRPSLMRPQPSIDARRN